MDFYGTQANTKEFSFVGIVDNGCGSLVAKFIRRNYGTYGEVVLFDEKSLRTRRDNLEKDGRNVEEETYALGKLSAVNEVVKS